MRYITQLVNGISPKSKIAVFYTLLLTIFFGAKNLDIQANPLPLDSLVSSTKPSYFNIPIKIGYEQIDRFIDNSLQGVLYADTTDNTIVRVVKQGKLSISGKTDSAEITLPVRVWYTKKMGPLEFSTDFDLQLLLSLQVSINSDWKLLTKTRLIRYTITRQPVAHLSKLEWDFTFVLNQILKYSLPKITTKVDESMAKSDMVSKQAKLIWQETQQPMLIDSAYQAWISMRPSRFYYVPIRFLKKEMLISAAMDCFMYFGLGPVSQTPNTSFSKLSLRDTLPQYFSTRLNVQIPVSSIDQSVKRAMKDSMFDVSKRKKIKIDDIEIKEKNGRIDCKVTVSGSFRFELLLQASMRFNDSLQAFYATDVDYSIESKQLLIKAADALFEEKIKKKLTDALQRDAKKDLAEATAALSTFLNHYNYENKLLVNGSIQRMQVSNVQCINSTINALLDITGKAEVSVIGIK